MTGARGIVFLDRDGTLIETRVVDGLPIADNNADTFALLPGVSEGCRVLKQAGYRLVMVTNQPDVSRGRANLEDVVAINTSLADSLGLDLVLACFHDDADECPCRKPRPGMLIEGAERLGLPLTGESVIVGDRWRDVLAGENAGVTTVLIGDGYGETVRSSPDATVVDFDAAVEWIRNRGSGHR